MANFPPLVHPLLSLRGNDALSQNAKKGLVSELDVLLNVLDFALEELLDVFRFFGGDAGDAEEFEGINGSVGTMPGFHEVPRRVGEHLEGGAEEGYVRRYHWHVEFGLLDEGQLPRHVPAEDEHGECAEGKGLWYFEIGYVGDFVDEFLILDAVVVNFLEL